MNLFQRFFGGALFGWGISMALLWFAFRPELRVLLPPVHGSRIIGYLLFLFLGVCSATLAMWTHFSLPPLARGKAMVTTGAFKYLRHPVYTSFLILFLGFALWMDNWIFILWAVVQVPAWHLCVLPEEKWMRRDFPAYEDYCRVTPRFIPGVW